MSDEKNKIHVARHIDLPRDPADMVPTREEACINGGGYDDVWTTSALVLRDERHREGE